ncbi:EAL domain-containing protein [Microbacterium koreense]|uniref:EAL domain-containing protein n=1 Tax=Microbacterium koreense TaxID=323761 RepID=A0ABW2ZPP9_9MICO
MHDSASLTRDLRAALERNELSVAYQLQWQLEPDASSPTHLKPVTVEALSRWTHPRLGVIPPDMFIPLAEQDGCLDELDLEVLRRAATQVAHWRSLGAKIGLSTNASPSRFAEGYARRIVEAIDHAGLDPAVVTIEVTETPAPQLTPGMRSAIDILHHVGASVSVDDYDGAATTVPMLESLPIDEVKIDRSLVQRADADADRAIADVVNAAEARGWCTVAEGIETVQDLDRARRRGCQRGQGYLWGAPASAAVVRASLLSV